jgi:hypothetical protein
MLILSKPWTEQPQGVARIDWGNPITRGLLFALTPQGVVSGVVQKLPTELGIAFAFDPAAPSPISTGVANGAVSAHSAFMLVKHPSMSGPRAPVYISNRVSGNNGFGFYQDSAASSVPNQTFTIGYVHGGVASYASPIQIAGANSNFVPIGFSASVSVNIEFFVRGKLHDTIAIGGITQSTSSIQIGRDVFFSSGPADYLTPLVAYWNRRLSAYEHAELEKNPWQLFEPRQIIIPLSVSSSGIPTLSAADIASFTSTTARPRVTVTY